MTNLSAKRSLSKIRTIPCYVEALTYLPWSRWSSRIVDRALSQLDLFPSSPQPQNIRSIGIEPPCRHCSCRRGYLYRGRLLCCRCDRPITGGQQ
ncbi:MAG: hypothetical protein HC770_13170 [Pseudanabaena sp. CRU_2_10]|nr:hypothetical protein [Pseudanabaena sp. CRU_2_10]